MTKVLVAGGTGMLGQAVAKALAWNQIDFLLGSRSQRIKDYNNPAAYETADHWIQLDLTKSEETHQSIGDDLNVVMHLASLPLQKIQGQPADVVLTNNLLQSIDKKNVQHLIYASIVGVDKIPFSYYQAKLECERRIEASGIPYTILRATQFHELVHATTSKFLKFPIGIVPKKIKMQPIAVQAVATELVEITKRPPRNGRYDIGGRKIYSMQEIVNSLLKARGEKKLILNLPTVGRVFQGFVKGYNTCDQIAANSSTWEEYLSEQYRK